MSWNLPPGCTDRMIDEATGGYDEAPEPCPICGDRDCTDPHEDDELMTDFPIFATHDDAYCFNCGGDWRDCAYPLHSGYAPGRGEWMQCCEKCGMNTYYDLQFNQKGGNG